MSSGQDTAPEQQSAVQESPESGKAAQETNENSPPPKPARVLDARQQRINELRLKFCIREEFPITRNMIHSDGSLNQE